MKYRFFTAALIIGLSSSTEAMDHTESNRERLQFCIDQAKLQGPITLIATYCLNEKQEILLGKNHAKDTWSVPVGPYRSSDQGMEKAAQRIVAQVTGLHNLDAEDIGWRAKSNVPLSVHHEKIVCSLVIHSFLIKNIPSDVQLREVDVCDEIDFSCCDSWQWFHKDHLPENTTLCTARKFEHKA